MSGQIWKNIRRSWTQHAGTQAATFTVLVATFTLVTSMLTLTLNMRSILYFWGESVHITAYMEGEPTEQDVSRVQKAMEELQSFKSVVYISKERAKKDFEKELKAFIPEILDDEEMGNPFPASFQMGLENQMVMAMNSSGLEKLAEKVSKIAGVEDVSYGQEWVKNYGALVTGAGRMSVFLVFILLAGSILVIGNSLRASLASRREEIEILELLGATSAMIRRPYIIEGAVLGFTAGLVAMLLSVGFYQLGLSAIRENIQMMAISSQLHFLRWQWILTTLGAYTLFGVLGSYLTVRRMNHGYAAARG